MGAGTPAVGYEEETDVGSSPNAPMTSETPAHRQQIPAMDPMIIHGSERLLGAAAWDGTIVCHSCGCSQPALAADGRGIQGSMKRAKVRTISRRVDGTGLSLVYSFSRVHVVSGCVS